MSFEWARSGGVSWGQKQLRAYAYNQVADEDLQNLSLETLASSEDFLQQTDENVAERGADEGAVQGHLGHTRGEVVAVLAAIMGDPRG